MLVTLVTLVTLVVLVTFDKRKQITLTSYLCEYVLNILAYIWCFNSLLLMALKF